MRGLAGRGRAVLIATAVLLGACGGRPPDVAPGEPGFAALIATLSEPGGYFDTDNLISNEASYLHAVTDLAERRLTGGAYLGVGPDQNFSYIAKLRPSVAFIVDIRRDNLLQHLLFKALFELAPTRIEYLTLLLGRPPPAVPTNWTAASVGELIAYADSVPADSGSVLRARRLVDSAVTTLGVSLSPADRATVARFHREFIDAGLRLKFRSFGRAPAPHYPTFGDLLAARDREGNAASYLAWETDYAFVRDLQRRDRVVPVVGDFAGPHALRAIGAHLRARSERVTAFYTSNVEFYLFRQDSFAAFAANVTALPRADRGVLIRSLFLTTFRGGHPRAVPGQASAQLIQSLDGFVRMEARGGYRSYRELVLDSH